MTAASGIKQIGSRNFGVSITDMQWSNKMDILATGNCKGEVTLQRLNGQKVVTFPSPGEDVQVTSLSWHADEPIIAACYSTNQIFLFSVEKKTEFFDHKFDEDLKNAYWSPCICDEDYGDVYRNRTKRNHDVFLPKLPNLNTIFPTKIVEDTRSSTPRAPCFLVVSTKSGKVTLFIIGILKCGSIDLLNYVSHPDDFYLYDVRLSGNFEFIYAWIRDGNQLKLLRFKNNLIEKLTSPILKLSFLYGSILETRNYISETIQCISEAWETVLIEMDNKLTKYTSFQVDGSITADFLELLLFGYATDEIEDFLMNDLTEKGLKKLEVAIELSFTTIQTLVSKPLLNAAMEMFHILNSIKSMSRNIFYCKGLLSVEATEEALRCCGSFLIKILEMQEIIDKTVNDMNIFFSWLCIVLSRLLQQDLSDETVQVTQEDIIHLAEYLNSFDFVENAIQSDKKKFNMEKVGQYLENSPLRHVSNVDYQHRWNKLLEENGCLNNCSLIYPHEKQLSLLQQCQKLYDAIDNIYKKADANICGEFQFQSTFNFTDMKLQKTFSEDARVRTSLHVNKTAKTDMLAITIDLHNAFVVKVDRISMKVHCIRLNSSINPEINDIAFVAKESVFIDLHFYTDRILSLLLKTYENSTREPTKCLLMQYTLEDNLSLSTTYDLERACNLSYTPVIHIDPQNVDSSNIRRFDVICSKISVSGQRKIASVLMGNDRTITIFEIENDDEEDEVDIPNYSNLDLLNESV